MLDIKHWLCEFCVKLVISTLVCLLAVELFTRPVHNGFFAWWYGIPVKGISFSSRLLSYTSFRLLHNTSSFYDFLCIKSLWHFFSLMLSFRGMIPISYVSELLNKRRKGYRWFWDKISLEIWVIMWNCYLHQISLTLAMTSYFNHREFFAF